MRPSSTRKLTPSSAMVVPNALRSPRASMHAMVSAFLLFFSFRLWLAACAILQQFFRLQAEPLNGCVDSGPFFTKKLLPFAPKQQTACAGIDEHAEAASGLDQPLVHQLLIALQNRERIDPVVGRDIAHGGQRIAFLENSVQYHRDHAVAKLAVNRLTVVPLTVHQVFQIALATDTLPSFPLEVKVRVHWLVPWEHVSPVLDVMVRVEEREHCMVHVSVLRAASDVEEIEFHRLAVRRDLARHARPISCVT